jgi:hypothetical protein
LPAGFPTHPVLYIIKRIIFRDQYNNNPENTGLLKPEYENNFQALELCEIEFAAFPAPQNFYVGKS